TSLLASSINSASFLTLGRSWSAICRHWLRAASASSWAKAVPIKAATTRRPCLPACASALRMKWTRQRCQVACKTLAMAAFSPSWASEMTSLTPRRPRLASLRRKSVEKGRDLAVDLGTQPADLALGDAGHAHCLDQFVDRAGRHALDVSLLDHRRQRLLGHPARLQETREIAALAQFRNAQFHRPGTGFPVALAIPVAMRDPIGAALAVRCTGQAFNFQLHQAMRSKTDHLAQQIGVRT